MSAPVVHTSDQILHPGARQDFEQHICRLIEQGKRDEALSLWQAVAEVHHLPPTDGPRVQGHDLPAMATMVCTAPDCQRCGQERGGFQFPWLGRWVRQGALVRTGTAPQQAWQNWHTSSSYVDLLQLQFHQSGFRLADFIPAEWAGVLERCASKPGCASRTTVFRSWRDWQLGHPTWIDPREWPMAARVDAQGNRNLRAQRSLVGWLESDPAFYLPSTCALCGCCTRNICGDCFGALCPECEVEADRQGIPAVCCAEMQIGEAFRYPMPPLGPGQSEVDVFRAIMGLPPRSS